MSATLVGARPVRDGADAAPLRGRTIPDVFARTAEAVGDRTALRWRDGRDWQSLTWLEYARAVGELAVGLRDLGLSTGDRVGILSANRPDWHVADLAVLSASLVSVPVYATSSASQVAYVLGHSGARVCVVDTVEQAAKILLRRHELPELRQVVVMDEPAGLDDAFVTSLAALRARGAGRGRELRARAADVPPDSLATIVYTSGTTGPPKGAMITHANVMATMRSLTSLVSLGPEDRFLSFLPLSHITERSISHFGQIVAGAETWFATSITTVPDDLRACRPTILFAVPRVWEKLRDGVIEELAHQPAPLSWLGRRYLAGIDAADDPPVAASRRRALAVGAERVALDAVIGRTIRRRLGLDRAHILACGAAPVAPELLRWFADLGLPIAEGYGQTEVSLCTSANVPGDIAIGTVGRPIPGVSVTLGGDGEILVRGDNVCAGYWRDAAATAELIDADGWLHSGDLGEIGDDGRLRVTGRKKDLIVTAYGKNIAPQQLETQLRLEPLIGHAVVVGEGRPFLTALLTLDPDARAEWAARTGRATHHDGTLDPDLADEIDEAIERVNARHSHAEGVRRWRIVPGDFTLAGGELTPTLKVKRNVVVERYADLIDEMYGEPG